MAKGQVILSLSWVFWRYIKLNVFLGLVKLDLLFLEGTPEPTEEGLLSNQKKTSEGQIKMLRYTISMGVKNQGWHLDILLDFS